ncbi:hypothetical protein ABZ464_26715 [Streptomyces sp. NPDC005820]|uniref:hypothetical protein n=1 Tax=Streptomyces sp. NPDC005820 TaxID=3157069 RepID=UPI0033D7AB6F
MTRPVHRAALLVVTAGLALSACGIPSTGVVEAGGPASGITATTPLYFVQDGTLVAVLRAVPEAGDAAVAIEQMLEGPDVVERSKGWTTQVARAAEPASLFPTPEPGQPQDDPVEPDARTAPSASASAAEPVRATVEDSRVSVTLPQGVFAERSDLAQRQLICTAGRARRLATRVTEPVTVTVTAADGTRVEGTDEDCPEP